MRSIIVLSSIILLCIHSGSARDLLIGSSQDNRLAWQHRAEYVAYPFTKRTKQIFYTEPSQQLIKGIIVRDLDHSEAVATITAGGVGFPFVNFSLESERGRGLNYQIEVYT